MPIVDFVLEVSGFQRGTEIGGGLGGSQSHRSTNIVLYSQGKARSFHRLAREISS